MYRRALRYAEVLDSDNKYDIVHNAFLYYFKKSNGKNLFDEHEGFVLRCVKWKWRHIYSNRTFNKQFVDYNDWEFQDQNTPLSSIISEENVNKIYNKIRSYSSGKLNRSLDSSILLEVLMYLERGYNQTEISELMGTSFQTISNHCKKLKSILLEKINNPFAGNIVKLSKRISRSTYNGNPEKYADFVYDTEKDCDANEYYQLLVNSEGVYILVKEKNDQ